RVPPLGGRARAPPADLDHSGHSQPDAELRAEDVPGSSEARPARARRLARRPRRLGHDPPGRRALRRAPARRGAPRPRARARPPRVAASRPRRGRAERGAARGRRRRGARRRSDARDRRQGPGHRAPAVRHGMTASVLEDSVPAAAEPLKFGSLPPLALYVHLPWCVRKCPYCDFNSYEARGGLPEDAYVDALLRDLDGEIALAAGRPLVSVFLGGGTPSLFSGDAIA